MCIFVSERSVRFMWWRLSDWVLDEEELCKNKFYFGKVEVDVLFRNRHVGSTPHSQTSTFLSCWDEGKVEAFIVDHVHLIVHEGLCNADMDEICIFVGERSVMFMWWRLLIVNMCKIYAQKNSYFGEVEFDVLFWNRHVGQLLVLKLQLPSLLRWREGQGIHSRQCPFDCSRGSCNADMNEICIFVGEWSVRLMWWWLLIDCLHKSFDNCRSQAWALRRAVMG